MVVVTDRFTWGLYSLFNFFEDVVFEEWTMLAGICSLEAWGKTVSNI